MNFRYMLRRPGPHNCLKTSEATTYPLKTTLEIYHRTSLRVGKVERCEPTLSKSPGSFNQWKQKQLLTILRNSVFSASYCQTTIDHGHVIRFHYSISQDPEEMAYNDVHQNRPRIACGGAMGLRTCNLAEHTDRLPSLPLAAFSWQGTRQRNSHRYCLYKQVDRGLTGTENTRTRRLQPAQYR